MSVVRVRVLPSPDGGPALLSRNWGEVLHEDKETIMIRWGVLIGVFRRDSLKIETLEIVNATSTG